MVNGPSVVQVELEPVEVSEEMVEEWREEWRSLSTEGRVEHGSIQEYVEKKARDFARNVLMQEQGHNDIHLRFDGYEVAYDD